MHVELKGKFFFFFKGFGETAWVLLNALTLKTWRKVFAVYKLQRGSPGSSGNVFDWWGGRRDLCRSGVEVGAQIPSALDSDQLCAPPNMGRGLRLEEGKNAATSSLPETSPFHPNFAHSLSMSSQSTSTEHLLCARILSGFM